MKNLIVIGENLNVSRKIRANSARIVQRGDREGIVYGENGTVRFLDMTDSLPPPEKRGTALVSPVDVAVRSRDEGYVQWSALSQIVHGADVIDLCVDELSHNPEERKDHIRWLVRAVQAVASGTCSVDSSDPETLLAGLAVYDCGESRPMINSVSLEEGRLDLLDAVKPHNALVIGTASGRNEIPYDDKERVANLAEVMAHMDRYNIALEDRFLDCLVLPVGAATAAEGSFGLHFLRAVTQAREQFGKEVHIFGGLSNVSFGLPRRQLINEVFINLAIEAGADCIMVDPMMNSPQKALEFKLARDVLMSVDEYARTFTRYCREQAGSQSPQRDQQGAR